MGSEALNVNSIPAEPVPLTPEQAEAMAQKQIKKHHVAMILLHWFNAVVWILEVLTGAALISSEHFRFAPHWFITIVENLFGGRANLLHFHIALGILWISVFLAYGIFGARTYLRKEILQKEIAFDLDDVRWLIIRSLRIVGLSNEPLPPQRIYNAGQKMFAMLVYAMVPVIMFTGLVMAFHLFSTAVVGWAIVIHFVAVGLVVSGLMVHVYMAAVLPEEKPAFFSMFTGRVNELFAYKHHFKWWREYKIQEEAWKRSIAQEMDSSRIEGDETLNTLETELAREEEDTRSAAPESWFQRVFRRPEYWPPYAAGLGLGLTLLAAFVLMGEGLGASSAFARGIAAVLSWMAPDYAANSAYWSRYLGGGQSPLINFIVFLVIGVFAGGLVSGWLAHRLGFRVDKGPHISTGARYAIALLGGIVAGYGARLAKGCTSGMALSGGATLAVGGWLFMLAFFAAGFLSAYFLRRLWL